MLAVELSKALHGQVINADSLQVWPVEKKKKRFSQANQLTRFTKGWTLLPTKCHSMREKAFRIT
jgi:hypothetical protein